MGPFTLLVITCYFIQSHTNKKGCNQNTNNQTYWTSTPNFNFFWPDVNSINSKYKVRAVRNRQRVPLGCWWIRLYLRGRQRGEGRGLCDCVFGLHVGKKSLGLELLSPNQSQMSQFLTGNPFWTLTKVWGTTEAQLQHNYTLHTLRSRTWVKG